MPSLAHGRSGSEAVLLEPDDEDEDEDEDEEEDDEDDEEEQGAGGTCARPVSLS